MRFNTAALALVAAAATLVGATNTVTFVNQDETTRSIHFTPSSGNDAIDTVEVSGSSTEEVEFPEGWIGNWYSVSEGSTDVPGMLGEVTFNGWNDLTYFDVSAIVNASDINGVKEIFPMSEINSTTKSTYSGCQTFLCDTLYIQSDDVQTVTTLETALVCTLGTAEVIEKRNEQKRNERGLVARHYVLGKLS